MSTDECTNEENLEDLFYKEITSTKRRHDLICAQVHDPHEMELPKVGLITVEDSESREIITLDFRIQNLEKNSFQNPRIIYSTFPQNLKEEESIFLGFLQMKILTRH